LLVVGVGVLLVVLVVLVVLVLVGGREAGGRRRREGQFARAGGECTRHPDRWLDRRRLPSLRLRLCWRRV